MELTDQDIHDAVEIVIRSFQESVTYNLMRPSGLIRPARQNPYLPNGEEAKAMQAATALTAIRSATVDQSPTSRLIFMFLCGYEYSVNGNARGLFARALENFSETGYEDLSAHQVSTFGMELDKQLAEEHKAVADKPQMEWICWIVGKRVRSHLKDGQTLNEIFEKEWMGDV